MSKEKDNHYGKILVAFVLMSLVVLAAGCTKEKDYSDIIYTTEDWIDLGLPSGLLWATRNVGASSPIDYGDYFAWGETVPKNVYNWSTYLYCKYPYSGVPFNVFITKYCPIGGDGHIDNLFELQPSDDAATANYGGRTPTIYEWLELWENTASRWDTINGVNGLCFTAPNGNRIFLPAAGIRDDSLLYEADSLCSYWSSSLYRQTRAVYTAQRFYSFLGEDFEEHFWSGSGVLRFAGLTVRAVRSAR